jgi:hypothetical protein
MGAGNDERSSLLHQLLRRSDAATSPAGGHVDDESLVMFVDGTLSAAERAAVVDHLADCGDCREMVRALMAGDEPSAVADRSWTSKLRQAATWRMALAASVFVALGGTVWLLASRGPGLSEQDVYREVSMLLRNRDFQRAQERLDRAHRNGIDSDRLQSLAAMSTAEVPGPLGLEAAGSLTEFGFGIGGLAARGADPPGLPRKRLAAYDSLSAVDSPSLEVRLNKGYLLLATNRPEQALQQFETLIREDANLPHAWLGKGIASFVLGDYQAAERAFERCLQLDKTNVAARLNLAMTLAEQNRYEDELRVWESLPLEAWPPTQRHNVQREIDRLRQFRLR